MVAGGSARWLDVSAERFPGWISSFARRHGDPGSLLTAAAGEAMAFTAPDGAVADATRLFRNRSRCRPASPGRTRSPRRSPRTPGAARRRRPPGAAGRVRGRGVHRLPACARRLEGRVAPGARPQRGGRLVAAPLRAPQGEAGERGARRGGGHGGRCLRPLDLRDNSNWRASAGKQSASAPPCGRGHGPSGHRGRRGTRQRAADPGWTRSSSAGTSGRSRSCGATRGWPRTWPSRRSGS